MTTKPWTQMTADEKADDLNADRVPRRQFDQLRDYTHGLERNLREAIGRIADLEKKLNSPADDKTA